MEKSSKTGQQMNKEYHLDLNFFLTNPKASIILKMLARRIIAGETVLLGAFIADLTEDDMLYLMHTAVRAKENIENEDTLGDQVSTLFGLVALLMFSEGESIFTSDSLTTAGRVFIEHLIHEFDTRERGELPDRSKYSLLDSKL